MWRIIAIFILLIQVNCHQIEIKEKCNCYQLTIQSECNMNNICDWNNDTNICEEKVEKSNSQSPIIAKQAVNCVEIDSSQACLDEDDCAWFNNKCNNCQNCEQYQNISTLKECQGISKHCISDGLNCINILECDSYSSSETCYVGKKGFCFWETGKNKCQDVINCSQLPRTLSTNQECRKQLKGQCGALNGGGCVELQLQCTSYNIETQCVEQTIRCIWVDNQCQEKTCENAPKHFRNNSQCYDYHPECTIKQGGGCVKKGKCGDFQMQEACFKDYYNNDCYWTAENKCVDKICVNAPKSFQINSDCQQYSINCITDGQGCVEDESCSSAIIESACTQFRLQNQNCIWKDSQCEIKTCQNAESSFTNHEQCQNYLFECTYNGSRCVQKSLCSAYTEDECQYVISLEGQCKWVVATDNQAGFCRKKKCHDVEIGNMAGCLEIDGCVMNGKKCQLKLPCKLYETKEQCKNAGLDGICVWTSSQFGKCKVMKKCQEAQNDQNACIKGKDRCLWKDQISYHQSSCQPHTCQSYYIQTGHCQSYFNFDFSRLNICNFSQGNCQPIDPSLLTQDECHQNTEQQYCWNAKLNSCVSCSFSELDGRQPLVDKSTIGGLVQIVAGIFIQIIV